MAKELSAEFMEIFGASTVEESLDATNPISQRSTPPLPIDHELFNLKPQTAAAAALCRQLEDDDLLAKLVGTEDLQQLEPALPQLLPTPAVAPGSVGSPAFADFIKFWTARAGELTAAKPHAAGATGRWGSSKHETAIRGIVNRARSANVFAPIRDTDFDGLWDKLVQSCVDHVCASVHEAAEELY